MSETRCTCGSVFDAGTTAAVQPVDDREYLELASCPVCGTTLCVRQWQLSPSSKWRARTPHARDADSAPSMPAAPRPER